MAKTNKGLDIEMAEVRKDVEYIKESISEIKSSSENRDKKFDEFIQEFREHAKEERELMIQEFEKQDAKYAPKWTEDAMKIAIGTICISVISAIMYVILK